MTVSRRTFLRGVAATPIAATLPRSASPGGETRVIRAIYGGRERALPEMQQAT
jgi:hypothetical protein